MNFLSILFRAQAGPTAACAKVLRSVQNSHSHSQGIDEGAGVLLLQADCQKLVFSYAASLFFVLIFFS